MIGKKRFKQQTAQRNLQVAALLETSRMTMKQIAKRVGYKEEQVKQLRRSSK